MLPLALCVLVSLAGCPQSDENGMSSMAQSADAVADGTLTAPVATTIVRTDQTTAGSKLVSGAITTSEPERLVAFLASDSGSAGAAFSSVTGCGLTWTRVVAANGQAGPAEVWTANAPSLLTGCTVTATRGFGSWLGAITVIGYTHAGGVGASRAASAASGAPSVTLTASSAQCLVAAVGVDWSNAVARTPATGQTLVSQTLASIGDTYWVQTLSAPLAAAGAVTIADTAPTGDTYNLAAVEILPGSTGGGTDAGATDSGTDASATDSGSTCVPSCSGKTCGSDGCGGTCGTCASGQSCDASGQCVSAGTITHGTMLTLSNVGPAGIGISSFTTVPGGTFTGTPLSGWGSQARIVGAGGETIDGFTFPQGTVVLQGANLTSEVTVSSGWLVLRGCKGSILLNHPTGDGGGGAALYSELTAFNAAGLKDGKQPAVSICHRCYFPHSGLENVYANNTTVTESWIAVDPGASGDHVDGIQTWGGQSYLNFSRNHLQWNATWNSTQSGLIAMYSDGSQNGYSGYDHVTLQNNYIVIGAGGGIGLHAPMGVSTTNMVVTGNRWAWSSDFSDPNYTPAVYRGTGTANYKINGNAWSDNTWNDGPLYVNQFLRPDNTTTVNDY